ncbi:putative cardiolipin synthase [Stella humosa]|uniref:Phospholipase D n=1 Tax=Stella humosa TaxID=94 RepID=A0A3N1MDL1_9PROT|nr:phospholipase D family protein [Stella humosa]ROQ01821.1 putative cardiolipin synthase [Stella humosa]BBK32208.1 phospholipase D family protein [Stella humosa]
MESILLILLLPVAGLAFVRFWWRLPSLEGRTPPAPAMDTTATRLGRAICGRVAANPGHSGFHALADGEDAFGARVLLAEAAERTLDVQYYLWRNDMSGSLLFGALLAAADRGVRVRLLLDDINTVVLDGILAALDAHPNIEVRLFNPVVLRRLRVLGYLTDFFRLNRRMHNKSFTADGQATIIGGRNIGDEYFGAAAGTLFADLDVLAIGPIADEVAADFGGYWSSASAYPVDRLLPQGDPVALSRSLSREALGARFPEVEAYVDGIAHSPFVHELLEGRLRMEWAPARMISDDPAKGLGLAGRRTQVAYKLGQAIGRPASDMKIVSPYFVPTASGVASFAAMAARGVRISVLTNSLEATDVAAVHAGYARHRKPLLEMGVTIYETRRSAAPPRPRRRTRRGIRAGWMRILRTGRAPGAAGVPVAGGSGAIGSAGRMGLSGSSLHAKTISVDGARAFVGSFNFDPRSEKLNTELGFLIESEALAQRIGAIFAESVQTSAYQVHLAADGTLYWTEWRDGKLVRHDREPGTTVWKRASVAFLAVLPIEWLL